MQQIDKKNINILAERINKLRKEQSSSLNKFVFDKGGVTSATWSRIENGKVNLKFSTLIKVASMLNVTIDKLLSGLNFDYSLDDE